ncbi:MAG: transcriptional repressor [Planctomycetota bacterium]|nr:transcriptional repressor [Planctomycetota bacterium]
MPGAFAPALPVQPGDVLTHKAPGESLSPEQILTRQLARRGLKLTNERREILRTILQTHQHFDAEWLCAKFKAEGVRVSRATVYRTLGLLCEIYLVREVFQAPSGAHYEHVYGHEHHEHMICLTCNEVLEFVSRRLEHLQEEACRAHGFHARRHHLQVFGYCARCHPCKAGFPPLKNAAAGV